MTLPKLYRGFAIGYDSEANIHVFQTYGRLNHTNDSDRSYLDFLSHCRQLTTGGSMSNNRDIHKSWHYSPEFLSYLGNPIVVNWE